MRQPGDTSVDIFLCIGLSVMPNAWMDSWEHQLHDAYPFHHGITGLPPYPSGDAGICRMVIILSLSLTYVDDSPSSDVSLSFRTSSQSFFFFSISGVQV